MVAYKPYNFVSYDGTDENGVRAEVFVQVNTGKVAEINEKTDKNVAEIKFSLEHLKYPLRGWIVTDSPAYTALQQAKEQDQPVTFRIETQRKKGIDRSLPIEPLKADMGVARESVRSIVVQVNEHTTREMVTNPNEDPLVPGSARYPATDKDATTGAGAPSVGGGISPEVALQRLTEIVDNPQSRAGVVDQAIALALFHGVSSDDVSKALAGKDKRTVGETPSSEPRASFSQEAPTWKEINSDGRLNLGSSVIAAGVSAESVVHKSITDIKDGGYLLGAGNIDETVEFFAGLVLTISDTIQASAYEITSRTKGARPDRAATSHVRVRGIVYDTIERLFPVPVKLDRQTNRIVLTKGDESLQQWIKDVGATSKQRFLTSIKVSTTYKGFKDNVPPASLLGGVPASQQTIVEPTKPVASASPTPAGFSDEEPPVDLGLPKVIPAEQELPPYTDNDYPQDDYEELPAPPEESEPANKNNKIAELQALADSVPAVEDPELKLMSKAEREEQDATIGEEPPTVFLPDEDEGDYASSSVGEVPLFPRTPIDSNNTTEELADEETIEQFKEMFTLAGFDITDKDEQVRISKLLRYTFGESKATNIPKHLLLDFTDYYAAGGAELIVLAMKTAVEEV